MMQFLDLTLPSPAENLALDEALLIEAERQGPDCEYFRVWESTTPFVVLGRASKYHDEVQLDFCANRGISVLRRTSGGASIVTGPGCLMYAVVLSMQARPQLRSIDAAHDFVLEKIADAISSNNQVVKRAGTSDLALEEPNRPIDQWRKVSGNSMRRAKTHLLYHGTILFDLDLSLIGRCLTTPPRMPSYRNARSHERFVVNLSMSRESIRQSLQNGWPCQPSQSWPQPLTDKLVKERYSDETWHQRL